MPLKVGDRIPEFTFTTWKNDGPATITTNEVFSGKKVVLFAVPGAFTPGKLLLKKE
jgi:peroxiredoxin